MMDYFARQQAEAAGKALRRQRQERAENRGRTRKETRELRWMARKSAAVCGECFRPLSPTDSVTMEDRVPICLLCTLDGIKLHRAPGCFPFYSEPHWHRTRCLNCGRPLRLQAPVGRYWDRWTPSFNDRTCCRNCQRLAKNKRNAERRRVEHEPITCIECGRSFVPKRADAVTCSNRCRQAQHRKREHELERSR